MSVLTLELPEILYQQLEAQADSEGVSLTQHVLSTLARQASFHYKMEALPPEAVQQQRESFDNFVASLRSGSEEEIDRILAEREPIEPESSLPPETIARVRQLIQNKRASSSVARQES